MLLKNINMALLTLFECSERSTKLRTPNVTCYGLLCFYLLFYELAK